MTVEQLLADLQAGLITKPEARLASYAQVVFPLLDTLKSITGKRGFGYQDYEAWWKTEGKKFEVID